ncbi:MAG: hypothetical protein M0P61_07980 [Ignavibacteriaceae bacterium]|jgi:transcription initiation factor TFIID subunit TAF12|nr:hypothetical protein [Ignavibacteriaceae bacterium]
MKKYLFLMLLLISILSTEIFSQQHHMGNRRGNPRERIDQLEKIKLIEELNMSEEVSVKFFARRNEFREKEKKLHERIDSLSRLIRDKSVNQDVQTSDAEWKKIIEEFISVEKMTRKNKINFVSSLQNLLTPKQMAQFLAFERKFREEVQDIILRGRQKPIPE